MDVSGIEQLFRQRFQTKPLLVRSPGRINLLGEHTDYNEGFVLPAAIDKEMYFALARNHSETYRFIAADFGQEQQVKQSEVGRSETEWLNYLLGVLQLLRQRGHTMPGFDCVFGGNIPTGAGLSSSAALTCGFGFGLNELFMLGLEQQELARIGQEAEHIFAGVRCGIMDQFANLFGQREHVLRLDCRTLDYEYFPLELPGHRLVLIDTQVKHELASTEYNSRREQCEAGVAKIQQYFPLVRSLRDVTITMLETARHIMNATVYQRCLYVVEENLRVVEICRCLELSQLPEIGKLLFDTHDGLQHEYEVSCKELDFLVEAARLHPGVLGARMMGGGFGGCTLNLIEEDSVEEFTAAAVKAFQIRFGIEPKVYQVNTVNGTSLVEPQS